MPHSLSIPNTLSLSLRIAGCWRGRTFSSALGRASFPFPSECAHWKEVGNDVAYSAGGRAGAGWACASLFRFQKKSFLSSYARSLLLQSKLRFLLHVHRRHTQRLAMKETFWSIARPMSLLPPGTVPAVIITLNRNLMQLNHIFRLNQIANFH
jgi:hypothetical protein